MMATRFSSDLSCPTAAIVVDKVNSVPSGVVPLIKQCNHNKIFITDCDFDYFQVISDKVQILDYIWQNVIIISLPIFLL